ncbi:MAG TPA: DUF1707 domain-containing protein [Trebonia sp.]|jgi:hypothetical protein
MAGPGDEIAAGASGLSRLRASHADREQVIEVLKAAFVQGRLDRDELDLRVGQALASRTYADLAALTADITPAQLTRARPPEPARGSANKKKKAVAALSCATLAYPGLVAALPPIPDGSPFAVLVIVVMFVLFGVVATGWLLLLHAWLDERAGRQSAQGLPPGAGGEASGSLTPANPAGQLPQVDRDPRQAAEATPIRRPHRASSGWRTPNRAHPLGRRYAIGYPGH